jgi:hypothetical protein
MMFLDTSDTDRRRPETHRSPATVLLKAATLALVVLPILVTSCQQPPHLVEYARYAPMNVDTVPVVIVGKIIDQIDIGPPHPARFDREQPMQLRRVNVRIENVLRGDIQPKTVSVYYFISLRAGGHLLMGMSGHGGHWHVGDHLIWFLRWDSGVLRTMLDTWAQTTVTVLSGSHPNYRPVANESLAHQIIDIMLDPGKQCDSDQWALAILDSSMRASSFDLPYTVAKLRQIAMTFRPVASEAALGELQAFSCFWPQYRAEPQGVGCPWPQLYPEPPAELRPNAR